MEKNQIAYLIRGEKWFNIRKVKEFREQVKEVEWIDAQTAIVADIKRYEDFMEKMKLEGFTDLGQLDEYEKKLKEKESVNEKSEQDSPDEKGNSKQTKSKKVK